MKKILIALVFLLLAPCVQAAVKPIPVVASFSIIGDMVRQVGGDLVDVKTLVGPDADVHTYQPTPEDAKTLAAARFVFINGVGLEGWMDRLFETSRAHGALVVLTTQVLPCPIDQEESTEPAAPQVMDPHAWQDLSNGRIYVQTIATMLERALPKNAGEIRARAEKYDAKLAALDAWIKSEINKVPAGRRKIITSHDAFGYFGKAYGVTFLAPQGISTEVEPSAAQVAKLIEQVKKEKIKTLFIENMSSPKLIGQIAHETGARPGGTLYSDALSAADGPAPTYMDMFKSNVPKLVSAMQETGK